VLGVIIEPPLSLGDINRDTVLQVGGWMQGSRPSSVKKNFCETQKSKNQIVEFLGMDTPGRTF
jgi:hypothetical protein